jgi:ribosomal protein S27E
MSIWPGGNCPECGESMPAKLIHCQNCRALLNPDLETDSVEIPEFIPLPEITNMVEVEVSGYYVRCPNCEDELRINKKYVGQRVQCKLCKLPFLLDFSSSAPPKLKALYARCPHCDHELRASVKYTDMHVACKLCGGKMYVPKQPS